MSAALSRTLPTDAVTPPGFPLAAAAASAFPASIPESGDSPAAVSWRFPALPDAVADAARTAFGVDVVSNAEAADPRDLPAFAAIFAQARAEQIVRALARRTNLVLPAASALVIGDGAVADRLAATLGGGGSRVLRGIADPVARLRAHLAGARLVDSPWPAADLVLTTGEGHAPVDPASVTGVLIDAASSSTGRSNRLNVGFPAVEAAKQAIRKPVVVREYVTQVGEGTWVVEAPGVFETLGQPSRVADALIALSILTVRGRWVPEPVEGPHPESRGRFDKLSDPGARPSNPVAGLSDLVIADTLLARLVLA
ncbi:hypothetical protein ACFY9N_01640 [Microbacterium sp. NPDC008134]|uniref:hypothetical protein n=1 Tax=Microbacterium sp. NPDC008134 TaxID=3364183 RepID=UPI0036EB354E